ncbi:hypothetical protein [Mangrovicoccus sp. HB161399]|uniref:hypothetical protein n=1 Tax=Mangrovicoccus sp. HB161399 TaxID=2720392 RepID=UPI001553A1D5|nr:hypothetical protein [Mangrovicoccus sp. HB161399]
MQAIAAITDNASLHVTWALTVLGGTLLTVVGTSHLSPGSVAMRLGYLLLLPAWVLLGASIYFGDRVLRNAIAWQIAKASGNDVTTGKIFTEINRDFGAQMDMLTWAGGCLVSSCSSICFGGSSCGSLKRKKDES